MKRRTQEEAELGTLIDGIRLRLEHWNIRWRERWQVELKELKPFELEGMLETLQADTLTMEKAITVVNNAITASKQAQREEADK